MKDDLATLDDAWQELATIMDPELPVVSIVDLGIVRDVDIDAAAVTVTLTPTYSGCPAIEYIENAVTKHMQNLFAEVTIKTQFSPAWTTEWISETGKQQLKNAGIAPPRPVPTSAAASRMDTLLPTIGTLQGDPPRCPHCDSPDTEEISRFGSTACKALWRCISCKEPFDYFKPMAGGAA